MLYYIHAFYNGPYIILYKFEGNCGEQCAALQFRVIEFYYQMHFQSPQKTEIRLRIASVIYNKLCPKRISVVTGPNGMLIGFALYNSVYTAVVMKTSNLQSLSYISVFASPPSPKPFRFRRTAGIFGVNQIRPMANFIQILIQMTQIQHFRSVVTKYYICIYYHIEDRFLCNS